MILFIFFTCCVLQPLLDYNCVFAKRESLHRFVVDEDAKPPIFGSYSYDPVKQAFVSPPPDNSTDRGADGGSYHGADGGSHHGAGGGYDGRYEDGAERGSKEQRDYGSPNADAQEHTVSTAGHTYESQTVLRTGDIKKMNKSKTSNLEEEITF